MHHSCMCYLYNSFAVYFDSFLGLFWKSARIGERKSQYIAAACVLMAVNILFWS